MTSALSDSTIRRRWAKVLFFATLVSHVGCDDSRVPNNPSAKPESINSSRSAEDSAESLEDILQLAKTGEIDAAVQRFVSAAPNNWIESSALEDLRISEATFVTLGRSEKARLQEQFIERVGEIKSFARTVMDRANQAKQQGDQENAARYVEAVNRLGRQLRDSGAAKIFQQTGKALAELKLSE